jgi:HK97 gp10 family phage protein
MKVDWNADKYLEMIGVAIDEAAKEGAEWIARSAQRQLMKDAKHPTGKLASEIAVVKNDDGDGYLVEAQGPRNYTRYYASFVELGTHKMAAVEHLRPATKRGRSRIRRIFAAKLDASVI